MPTNAKPWAQHKESIKDNTTQQAIAFGHSRFHTQPAIKGGNNPTPKRLANNTPINNRCHPTNQHQSKQQKPIQSRVLTAYYDHIPRMQTAAKVINAKSSQLKRICPVNFRQRNTMTAKKE